MKRLPYLLAFLLAAVTFLLLWMQRPSAPATTENDAVNQLNPEWMRHPYWRDGKAEINLYRSTVVKYGQPRQTDDVVHIVVGESHRPDLLVKADDWRQPGLVPMLKFNQIVEVQTGIYPYRQMLSVFFNRADGRFAKLAMSSQEWCGTSFKEVVHFRGRSSYRFNTYWDGQGAGSHPVDFPSNMIPRDALPVQLRALHFQPGTTFPITLLPGQVSSKAKPPEVRTGQLRVLEKTWLEVPAGRFETYPVVVTVDGAEDRLWFEAIHPNRMIRRATPGGDLHELLKSEKLAYWELNRPGDEGLLD